MLTPKAWANWEAQHSCRNMPLMGLSAMTNTMLAPDHRPAFLVGYSSRRTGSASPFVSLSCSDENQGLTILPWPRALPWGGRPTLRHTPPCTSQTQMLRGIAMTIARMTMLKQLSVLWRYHKNFEGGWQTACADRQIPHADRTPPADDSPWREPCTLATSCLAHPSSPGHAVPCDKHPACRASASLVCIGLMLETFSVTLYAEDALRRRFPMQNGLRQKPRPITTRMGLTDYSALPVPALRDPKQTRYICCETDRANRLSSARTIANLTA